MQLLRSILFTSLFFSLTALYAVAVLLSSWLPTLQRYRVAYSWGAVNLWLLRALCGLDYRVQGRENLPAGAHVSMWKHSSSWETIAQAVICPPQAWVLKRELMWIPLVGWAISRLKPIAINRSAGAAAVNQVVNQGKQRLAQGLWVLIFPEGTRVAPGEAKKYGLSGAVLAARAGCKVIPVVHNAGVFWPRRGWLKKRGVIDVVIGPPIEAANRDPREINEDVRSWIEGRLTTLPQEAPPR